MAERPIVHIGYHKTGTTWFQQHFYARVAGARYVPRRTVQQAFLEPSALHFDPAEARALIGPDDGKRLLLCEEGLSGYIHNGGMAGSLSKDVAHRLKAVLPDADIVIFIRSQPSMIAACYSQYLKGCGTFSANRYLFPGRYLHGARAERIKGPRFSFDHFDYDRLIAQYIELFGPDRVHVFPFEQFRADSMAFAQRFAAIFDLDVQLDATASRWANRSYNRPALLLSRLFGLFTARTVDDKYYMVHIPYWYALTRALCEAVTRLLPLRSPSPRALLGRKAVRWIEERFVESNRRLAAQTGLALHRYKYPLGIAPDGASEETPRGAQLVHLPAPIGEQRQSA